MSLLPSLQPKAARDDDLVKDVSLSNFMVEVIEASKSRIVIVDFWAPWCGPCKQLTPVLEKLVRAEKGAVALVKIDIDKDPEIAQQMGVQSIPAVFAFSAGRPVDGFMGALPEAEIKAWMTRIITTVGAGAPPLDQDAVDLVSALKQADEYFQTGDRVTAAAIYADVLDQDPANAPAHAGQIRCALADHDINSARGLFEKLPPDIAKDKVMDTVRAALELAEQAAGSQHTTADLEKKLSQNPADHATRFDLAMACYAAGDREKAVDHLLDIVKRDRKWNDEAARKQLVKFFEAFGAMDPLTIASRRRLSSIMFS